MYRVSTEKQATDGASLDAQERQFRELAARLNWTIIAEYRGCESATQAATERRVLQQVLECIREKTPDALYVHEQSRLTRGDELEVAMLLRELRERRTKIIVGGVVRDLASIDERFMVGIQSLVDRAEAERIRERLMRGKRERGKQGRKNSGPAPYGYRNPRPGEPGRGVLQVVPEEAEVVRRIFDLAFGGLGARAIADRLNKERVPSPRGVTWGKTMCTRVLRNPNYIGVSFTSAWKPVKGRRWFRLDLNNPDAIVVPGAHEPIVQRSTWDAVHSRKPLPRTPVPRMLAGLLWLNGEPAHGDSNKGVAFYRCRRGTQGLPWLDTDVVDKAVWEVFVSLAKSPEFVASLIERSRRSGDEEPVKRQLDAQIRRANKLSQRLERLTEMRADGEITKNVFVAKSTETRDMLNVAHRTIHELQGRLATVDQSQIERLVRAVRVLTEGKSCLTSAQRRRILCSVVERVDVKTERAPVGFLRGEDGRIRPGRCPRWRIAEVSLRVRLAAKTGTGGLDTGCLPCALPAGTVADHRAGLLGTNY